MVSSIQALVTLGATNGWHGSRIFSPRGVSRRGDDRPCRFRDGPRSVRHLAAHPPAGPDRKPDGELQRLAAGLRCVEAASCARLAQLRAWPKDVQRAVFQPVIIATSAMTVISLGASGAFAADTVKLFLLGLPMLLAGTWVGMKLYGRLDEASFRKIVLILLLVSGIFLVVPGL